MLQRNADGAKSTPPIFNTANKSRAGRIGKKSRQENRNVYALDAIRADIAPLEPETDLLNTLRQMAEENQTRGMVALFDGFAAISQACQAIENEPRSDGFAEEHMEAEALRAWSKAYMVADFLKDQPVDDLHRDEVGRVLLTCALMMGHGMKQVAKIAAEFAALPDGFQRTAEEMQPPTVGDPGQGGEIETLACDFEEIAAQLMGPMLNDDGPVSTALSNHLIAGRVRDEFCRLEIKSDREAAFIVLMASGEVDGVRNGINGHERECERRLNSFLFMLSDYFAREVKTWPATMEWCHPVRVDPRESADD